MGKRKAAKKPQGPKKREVLAVQFACLFCNHENSVTVKIDRKLGVGTLKCKVCSQSYECSINYLSAPVDVYAEWVDACDSVAKNDPEESAGRYAAPRRTPQSGENSRSKEDDGIIDDEDDIEGYGGEEDGIVDDDEY